MMFQSIIYVREPDGSLICRYISTVYSYYHFDQQGSTLFLTGNTGLVTDRYSYDAWGNLVTKSGSTGHPFLYVGKYGYYAHYQDEAVLPYTTASLSDKKPSFLQTGVRQYFPKIGRYLQEDPIRDGLNWFLYCNNNPVNYVDYTGEEPLTIIGSIVTIIGGGIIYGLYCNKIANEIKTELEDFYNDPKLQRPGYDMHPGTPTGGDKLVHCMSTCMIRVKMGFICAKLAALSTERGGSPFGNPPEKYTDSGTISDSYLDELANMKGIDCAGRLKCKKGNEWTDCMSCCRKYGFKLYTKIEDISKPMR